MTENITKYPITGIGVGPGDPELITVKALKELETADVVYYAASQISGDSIQSFSKPIIDHYHLKALCRPLHFPMAAKNREQIYLDAFETLKADYELGLRVIMVCEGDLGFYSTLGYITKLAKKEGIPVQSIPGIPAFIAGAAAAQTPLVEGNRSFINIAHPKSFSEIEAELKTNKAVVVMKMKSLKNWHEFLTSNNRHFVYLEKIGTNEEYITSNPEEIKDREIPYFSLIIFPGIE